MPKIFWFIITLIIALSAFLRFSHFPSQAPFDWDQDRDYSQVIRIAQGEYVPLGPVAKGQGGFYLGSLYYYLLFPAYTLMQGSLGSLPATSIFLDCLAVIAIVILLRGPLGLIPSTILALMWGFSWFLIDASRVSWNVSLIPLWSVLTLSLFSRLISSPSKLHFYLLGLLAGISFHVHVATLPLIPILMIINYRHFRLPLKSWLIMFVWAVLPLIPLIHYDLTHHFANLHLVRGFLASNASVTTPILAMFSMAATKLGKVLSGIFLAKYQDNLLLGLFALALSMRACFAPRPLIRIAGVWVLLSFSLVVALRDYGFPEYYFAPAYLALCLVFLDFVLHISRPLAYVFLAAFIYLNLHAYQTTPSSYSLSAKTQLVTSLLSYPDPLDLTYQLSLGRDGGFRYLVKRSGLIPDAHARSRIVITDKLDGPVYIDGELTRDLTRFGSLKTALYIVQ